MVAVQPASSITDAIAAPNARFPGSETLSKWAHKPYRSGWQVENL
ncbi:MAG: hypothetical protein ACKOV8_08265 [Phycisphaerales bacterium]